MAVIQLLVFCYTYNVHRKVLEDEVLGITSSTPVITIAIIQPFPGQASRDSRVFPLIKVLGSLNIYCRWHNFLQKDYSSISIIAVAVHMSCKQWNKKKTPLILLYINALLQYVLLYTLQIYLSSIESIYTCSSKISSFSLCYNTSIASDEWWTLEACSKQTVSNKEEGAHMHNV